MSALKKKIDDKSLLPDDFQLQVVADLQKLYEITNTYEPPASAGALAKWLSFGSKKSKEPGVRGLYIYGSVGGGKTMLMDMFYDCCQVFDLESILGISISLRLPNFRFRRKNASTSIHS